MISKLVKEYGEIAQLDICIEECAELIHSCSKLKRALGNGYETGTSVELARSALQNDLGQAVNAIRGVMLLSKINSDLMSRDTYWSDVFAFKAKFGLGCSLSDIENEKWKTENACLLKLLPKETENV